MNVLEEIFCVDIFRYLNRFKYVNFIVEICTHINRFGFGLFYLKHERVQIFFFCNNLKIVKFVKVDFI